MRKKILLFFILAHVVFSSCNQNPVSSDEQNTDEHAHDHSHNSQHALDWKGVYRGTLPCIDCDGIETTITLNEDFSYRYEEKFLGKPDAEIKVKSGIFSWTSDGNAVQLQGLIRGADLFSVGENALTQLDANGNKIVGEQASQYVLKKSDVAVSSFNDHQTVLGQYEWQLLEVIGQTIEKNDKTPTLYFDFKAMRYNGFAGCNQYNGIFEFTPGAGIHFGEAAVTKKACADPGVELEFLVMLKKVDRYTLNGETLSLHQGEASPMARFAGVPKK